MICCTIEASDHEEMINTNDPQNNHLAQAGHALQMSFVLPSGPQDSQDSPSSNSQGTKRAFDDSNGPALGSAPTGAPAAGSNHGQLYEHVFAMDVNGNVNTHRFRTAMPNGAPLPPPNVGANGGENEQHSEADVTMTDANQSFGVDGPGGTTTKKNDRRHKCTVCGKLFNRPSSLKIHLTTHTGERRGYFLLTESSKLTDSQSNILSIQRSLVHSKAADALLTCLATCVDTTAPTVIVLHQITRLGANSPCLSCHRTGGDSNLFRIRVGTRIRTRLGVL